MPARKRVCNCRLCKSCYEPIDTRTIESHNAKYGIFKSDSDIESEPSPVSSPHRHRWPTKSNIDTDEDSNSRSTNLAFNVGRSSSDTELTATLQEPLILSEDVQHTHFVSLPKDFLQIDSGESLDIHMHDAFTADLNEVEQHAVDAFERSSTYDEESSDGISSIADDSDIDTDSSYDSEPNLPKEVNQWSFFYDKDQYSSHLAVTKIPGTNTTILQWLCVNFDVFSSHPSISKTAFSSFLNMQAKILGNRNNIHLPTSYYEARKLINPYLIQKKVFHACVNDCLLFRNTEQLMHADLTSCPTCGEARYIDNNSKCLVPRRKFMYIPLGPRLARIYGEVNLAKLIQSHPGSEYYGSDMWDIHHAPVWHKLYAKDGYFLGDKNGISLSFELDGVNPFHNIGVTYSMTPMMVTLLNLPRQERNQFSNIYLMGIIPGKAIGKAEASNIGPYVEVMVDELLYLTQCKVAYPGYDNAPVNVKIKLLLYVLDYPGLSKLFNKLGSGSLSGCHWCLIGGEKCSHLDKVVYLNNRRYLTASDSLRQETTTFVDKTPELKGKPEQRNYADEMRHRTAYDNAANKTRAACVATATGCKGEYILMKLPGHNRLKESLPDSCHTIKDVTQNIMNIVTGRNVNMSKIVAAEKQKDRQHVISSSEEETRARHRILTINRSNEKAAVKNKRRKTMLHCDRSSVNLPVTYPFSLTKVELKQADERAKSMNIPLGVGLKPAYFISKPGSLKSHDWKVLATEGILKFCLKDCLGKECRETLFSLLDSMTELCQECQEVDQLEAIEERLNKSLALVERNFPVHAQNITTHLLHHIPDGIREFGPVYSTWMYTFERFNSWLCKRAINMRFPEATAIETYLIYDWCNFVKSSGRLLQEDNIPTLSTVIASERTIMEDFEESSPGHGHVKKMFTPSKRMEKLVHKSCGIKLPRDRCRKCTFRKYGRHIETNTNTHRATTYTCAAKDKHLKSKSSYICFEENRGLPNCKISSGKYVRFGRITCFVEHESEDSKVEHFACVKCYFPVNFDPNTKMWHAEEATLRDRQVYINTERISNPLITAVENNHIWFLNSSKLPFM